MPSLMHRRLSVLEDRRERRDVPSLVLMVEPMTPEKEAEAAAHRKRGTIVVVISQADADL